jgi:hypothetical protein
MLKRFKSNIKVTQHRLAFIMPQLFHRHLKLKFGLRALIHLIVKLRFV